jgi:hypothetical protein
MFGRIRGRMAGALLLSALAAGLVAGPALAVHSNPHPGGFLHGGHGSRVSGQTANVIPDSPVVRRPDGRIRLAVGTASGNPDPYVGNGVYNTTGAHQTSRADYYSTMVSAFTFTFDISIQNDGTRADRFKVKATGTAASGWKVRFFRGTTNITTAVVAGTYQTSSLAPSATYLIKAKVTRTLQGVNPGPWRLVTIASSADATKKDAVKFVMKLATCGC